MAVADPSSDAQDSDDERGRRRGGRGAKGAAPDATGEVPRGARDGGPPRGAATGGIDLDRLQLESDDGFLDPRSDVDWLDEVDAGTERSDAAGEGSADGGTGDDGLDDPAHQDVPDGAVDARVPAGATGRAAPGRSSADGVGSSDERVVDDAPTERATPGDPTEQRPGESATGGVDTARTAADDTDADDAAVPPGGDAVQRSGPADGPHRSGPQDAPPRPGAAARTLDTPATAVAPVAAGRTLTALDPGMKLADRLESDRVVTAPTNRQARSAALAAMFVGLGVLVLAQRSAAAGGDTDLLGIPAGWLGALLALAGAVAWGLLAFYGPQRVLDLELAPDQQQQWEEVEAQARMTRSAMSIGTTAAAGGLVLTAIALATAPDGLRLGAAGSGLVIAVAGGLLLGFAYARRGPLRLLYIQTLVLARLERTGVGRQVAADPKTADVLMALDALLGELPESSVRRFLSKPEAEWYLDMVARIREGEHG